MPTTTSDQPSFTCPLCGATSYHPQDIENRYCGRCHKYVDDYLPRSRLVVPIIQTALTDSLAAHAETYEEWFGSRPRPCADEALAMIEAAEEGEPILMVMGADNVLRLWIPPERP